VHDAWELNAAQTTALKQFKHFVYYKHSPRIKALLEVGSTITFVQIDGVRVECMLVGVQQQSARNYLYIFRQV